MLLRKHAPINSIESPFRMARSKNEKVTGLLPSLLRSKNRLRVHFIHVSVTFIRLAISLGLMGPKIVDPRTDWAARDGVSLCRAGYDLVGVSLLSWQRTKPLCFYLVIFCGQPVASLTNLTSHAS